MLSHDLLCKKVGVIISMLWNIFEMLNNLYYVITLHMYLINFSTEKVCRHN